MSGPWPDAFFAFRQSPSVSDEALLDMAKLFAEHAAYLMPRGPSQNEASQRIVEDCGLLCVGVLFPEFKEAGVWRETAAARVCGELERLAATAGTSIGVGDGDLKRMLPRFEWMWEFTQANGIALPGWYRGTLEGMRRP